MVIQTLQKLRRGSVSKKAPNFNLRDSALNRACASLTASNRLYIRRPQRLKKSRKFPRSAGAGAHSRSRSVLLLLLLVVVVVVAVVVVRNLNPEHPRP